MAVNDSVVLDDLDIWAESGHDGVCKKVVYATVKGGVLKIHFPEVKAGQGLISGIAIASVDSNLQPTVFPASDWSWEKAGKEVMEKTPKELLPEDKNARVSVAYEAETATLKGKFRKKNIASKREYSLIKEKVTVLNGISLPDWHRFMPFALSI